MKCLGWLILVYLLTVFGNCQDDLAMPPEDILAVENSKDWLPPVPMFMKDASEESKKEFQQLIMVDADAAAKQTMVDEFVAKQPEKVRQAYADFQKQVEMQKEIFQFSLENELEKAKMDVKQPIEKVGENSNVEVLTNSPLDENTQTNSFSTTTQVSEATHF